MEVYFLSSANDENRDQKYFVVYIAIIFVTIQLLLLTNVLRNNIIRVVLFGIRISNEKRRVSA